MGPILYYLLLLPLSKLPLNVLYGLSGAAYWLAFRLFSYRKRVVRENIRGSFPDWPTARVDAQVDAFYRYFFDTFAESIKLFAMSTEEAIDRSRILNPEILYPYANEGRDVILVGGHYGNWEIGGLSFPTFFPRQTVMVIYSPLKNDTMDAVVRSNRQRTGVYMLSRRKVKWYYETKPVSPSVDIFVADQSPSNHVWEKVHWTTFLNRPTGFVAGPERYAVRENMPIFYINYRMKGRGRYEATISPLAERPREVAPGFITEAFARKLEEEIRREPTPWLWTHRRWKRGVPDEVVELLKTQPYVAADYEH